MKNYDGKTAVIYVFSGTGNTLKAAKEFEKAFSERGVAVSVCKITADFKSLPSPESYDFVGVAYPIYGFNAPKIVVDFVRDHFPENGDIYDKKVFVIKTSGEPVEANDASSDMLKRILGKRGYVVSNEYHYVMPYNMIFRHDDYDAVKMYETMKALAPLDADEVLKGEWHTLRPNAFGKLASVVCRIEYPWFEHNGKRFKVDESKCLECGKCVNNCPMGNVKLEDGKITFGGNCVMCARCSFGCPADAISIGLLNGWKVNGKYPTEGDFSPTEKGKRYCKKAYERYYAEAEDRIGRAAKK